MALKRCCYAAISLVTLLAGDVSAQASARDSLDALIRRLDQPIVHDSRPITLAGAWRVIETAARAPGESWVAGAGPQAGIYVFSARHYSYFYVPGTQPRAQFANANRPTAAEKAAAYGEFIAGAGTYTFDGRTLEMTADLRKNPNEMTGGVWRFVTELRGDTLSMVFPDPPFLPGREWRTTLVRIE